MTTAIHWWLCMSALLVGVGCSGVHLVGRSTSGTASGASSTSSGDSTGSQSSSSSTGTAGGSSLSSSQGSTSSSGQGAISSSIQGNSSSGVASGTVGSSTGGVSGILVSDCDGGLVPEEVWTEEQIPTTPELHAVAGIDDEFAMAVGSSGAILQWDGIQWASVASPVSSDLNFIWGDSRSNIWTVGGDSILHFDGTSWSVQIFDGGGELGGVYGNTTGAWATSGLGVLSLSPNGWTLQPLDGGSGCSLCGQACAICGPTWGTSRSDLWIVNEARGLFHLTDAGLALIIPPMPPSSIWGTSDGDLFASGAMLAAPGPDEPEYGFTENMLGGSWDTYSLPDQPGLTSMGPIWGACGGEVWIAENGLSNTPGLGSAICRWSGQTCVTESLPGMSASVVISGISGSQHHLWAVGGDTGSGHIYHALVP
jgi:hypothetical protein